MQLHLNILFNYFLQMLLESQMSWSILRINRKKNNKHLWFHVAYTSVKR